MAKAKKQAICNHPKRDISQYRITPLDTGIRNFNILAKYYMYYAPNIDCIHSQGIVGVEQVATVLQEMLNQAGMRSSNQFLQRIKGNPWITHNLDGDSICFHCQRMLCNRFVNEDELSALLRHIRNSFAHGKLFVWRTTGKEKEAHVLIEDVDSDNRRTARIVTTVHTLEAWKAILENTIAIGA